MKLKTLYTDRLILRNFELSDVEELYESEKPLPKKPIFIFG
jgi:hypothetical protein